MFHIAAKPMGYFSYNGFKKNAVQTFILWMVLVNTSIDFIACEPGFLDQTAEQPVPIQIMVTGVQKGVNVQRTSVTCLRAAN
uniref:Uncharacterized protein n=1 Tax=Magallana gigas TaxID=29159 RepID=K1PV60_MAGGI